MTHTRHLVDLKRKVRRTRRRLDRGMMSYQELWASVSKKTFDKVLHYYNNVDLDFLEDKVKRELDTGNAGGPQIRSRFNRSISTKELSVSAIRGLKILLSIKTIENAYNFPEKTRITDESLLTDLAWHQFMMKPHKYYIVTNSILNLLMKDQTPSNKVINMLIKQVNKKLEDGHVITVLEDDGEDDHESEVEEELNTPVLVRHGTNRNIKLEVDIRDFIKMILPRVDITGYEWNMPTPLFETYPYER